MIAKRIEDSINRTSLEADNKEAAITLLNVNFLIKDILLQKKVEYMEHDIKIIYNKPDNYHDININGVKDDFSRMLSNLINNAVEACSDKYGIIRIELQKSNSITTLTINDNGCGIPGEVLQMLRDGKTITHGKTSGHGIGMQQIREAITKCNGTLDIKSILGNGSTFAIMFEAT